MFAVVTCYSSMASCTLCQYPLVYDAITNTNPHKFVKKVTYSRSAQYFNFLKSTKFYIYKKKKNQIISLKNKKVRAFASVCAKIHVYFRIKPIFSILHTHFSKYYASNYIFYTTFIKISIFLDFFNCFSFVTYNNRHLFSSFILVNN